MTLTLTLLATQIREVLAQEDTPASRERVAAILAHALADREFVAAQFATEVGARKLLHEDLLGFCIAAHEFPGAKVGPPHDHGPSWAIYGQAEGETLMRDFEQVAPGQVRETRRYLMRQGDVHVYNEGDIHGPSRTVPTRLLRIEGRNLAGLPRSRFEVAADSPAL